MTREYTPVNHAPRVCDYCGETYKPRQKNSVRCPSDDCRKAHNRKKMREYTKRWSEELGHSYHSRERSRTTYNKTCAFCGAAFTTHQAKAKYCTSTCGVQHRSHTPGYFGAGCCPTCGAAFEKTGVAHEYCTTECRPTYRPERTTPYVPADMRSPLRKGYEDKDRQMFFAALKADCNVNEATNCWEWKRRTKSGYPTITWANKSISLHRASLEMSEGKPLGVLAAHHKCANTTCVNPEHLEPATAADNNLEMNARHSYIARIAELERALSAVAPGHEALNRVPTN